MESATKGSNMEKPMRILGKIRDAIGSGEIRVSRTGTPHLVVKQGDHDISFCYMGKRNFIRCFYPYPSHEQTKVSFKEWQHAVSWFVANSHDQGASKP